MFTRLNPRRQAPRGGLDIVRAAGCHLAGAVLDRTAVPYLDGARDAVRDGFVSGGTRRDLAWVDPHVAWGAGVGEAERLLPADAQTPGARSWPASSPARRSSPELVPDRGHAIDVAWEGGGTAESENDTSQYPDALLCSR